MEDKSPLNAEVPEAIRRAAKSCAALRGETLSEFVTRALQQAVEESAQTAPNGPLGGVK